MATIGAITKINIQYFIGDNKDIVITLKEPEGEDPLTSVAGFACRFRIAATYNSPALFEANGAVVGDGSDLQIRIDMASFNMTTPSDTYAYDVYVTNDQSEGKMCKCGTFLLKEGIPPA